MKNTIEDLRRTMVGTSVWFNGLAIGDACRTCYRAFSGPDGLFPRQIHYQAWATGEAQFMKRLGVRAQSLREDRLDRSRANANQ